MKLTSYLHEVKGRTRTIVQLTQWTFLRFSCTFEVVRFSWLTRSASVAMLSGRSTIPIGGYSFIRLTPVRCGTRLQPLLAPTIINYYGRGRHCAVLIPIAREEGGGNRDPALHKAETFLHIDPVVRLLLDHKRVYCPTVIHNDAWIAVKLK